MCGRMTIVCIDDATGVATFISLGRPLDIEPDWPARAIQVRPGARVPAIVADDAGEAESLPGTEGISVRVAEPIWGFAAGWQPGKLVFNTRIETATGPNPGMWREAVARGRCVIPALAFFEPHGAETAADPRTGRLAKRQYRFDAPGKLVLIAGVCADGRLSVVTTEPNGDVAPVHDRMPLVVGENEVATWFGPDFASLADRSAVRLRARPEGGEADATGGQLSLF